MDPNKLTLVQRLKAPTPPFFKKVMAIGAALVVIGGGIAAAPATLGISIPICTKIGGIIIAAGTAATLIGKTAVDAEAAIKKTEEGK